MSAHTKKLLTKSGKKDVRAIFCLSEDGEVYRLPVTVAQGLSQYTVKDNKTTNRVKDKIQASLSIDPSEAFSDIRAKYTRPGVLMQGIRHRAGKTQIEFAKLIGITQADLSKIENGKRPIGKTLAKRIAKKYDVNPHSLLSVE